MSCHVVGVVVQWYSWKNTTQKSEPLIGKITMLCTGKCVAFSEWCAFKFSGSLFEEFCLCRFHAGLLMSNFDYEHRVNIHFEHNTSLRWNHMLAVSERILWPRMFYNSGLQLQAIMWLLNNHWSLTVKNNQHCV